MPATPGGSPTRPRAARHQQVGSSPSPSRSGALLEVVDTSIVNVALTEMQNSLGATLSEVSWVVSSYAVANVIILPMTAWLGQRFGKKRYFIFSLVAFTIASVLCGMAHQPADADPRPGDPGARRRRAARQGAGDPLRDLPARGAGHGPGLLRRHRHRRAGHRPHAGRLPRHQRRLALDFFINVPVGIAAVLHVPDLPPRGREAGEATPAHRLGRASAS